MRTYDELVSAIIQALPRKEEIEALSDEQIQTLRKYVDALKTGGIVKEMRMREICDEPVRPAMTLEHARRLVAGGCGQYIHHDDGLGEVILDGWFSADHLEAIAVLMRTGELR